ncbi:polysaccharide biosynthesis tyrosine autokinase [Deinococcus ruber]|uniref:polysaccharide biosynthesis tyrosine autokinase n=1 Tax=Deinococcus ruber TaxID=1848197 RepID=UPI00166E44B8|nr:polysaccharide biosynthesis tyrosine autokinase [Deinococcus ruber]
MPLLLTPLVLGGATYLLFNRQAPVYQASTSLMSAPPDSGNSVLNGSSVIAAQLPQGAVDEVVHSSTAVNRTIQLINKSNLAQTVKLHIVRDLKNELADQKFKRLTVTSRLDQFQRGVYDIRASAESPQAAQLLATASTQALLEWDLRRAQEGVSRARQNIQDQLNNINARLAVATPGSTDQQSLVSARGQLILNLSQATVFEEGARGNLTLLADANTPRDPVAPKPRQNALLVALVTLFAGAGLTLLLDSLRRKVRSTGDVIGLDIPVLGELPRLPNSRRSQVVRAARNGKLYESTGFIRVNLGSNVPQSQAVVAVTSARPGEGKSSVVAATAISYALAGRRVLIIDLDLHRPTQQEFWQLGGRPWVSLPGATQAKQTSIALAFEHPEQASAIDVGEGIHILPAGESGRRAASLLTDAKFPVLLKQWATAYDIVLIDTPPVLAVSDALVVARHADGLLLVVASEETSVPEIQRVMRDVQTNNTKLIGVVLNKVRRNEAGYYYTYQYDGTK